MFNNDIFEKKWQIVEKGFKQFINAQILPLEIREGKEKTTVTEESLRNQIKAIHDETFTISVCGQVKAGKSTLLNSLFFGDNVLPVFDTPMTAKLTFLEYREGKPGFEVDFYNSDEWDEILHVMKENNPDARNQLNDRIRYCAENFGVWSREWIGHKTAVCSNLNDLALYVSVPENGENSSSSCGKYTPFVKQVRIHLPYENLKNLRIVDTPGLNDSNIINSIQTTEWVKHAHAVVYVLDVTGAHEPDIQFFQKYFPGSAVEARVFVQNKIDSNPEAASVKEQIRKYGRQNIYQELGLFGENETICSYSGLLSLRASKIKAGKTPSEEEDWAYNFDWIDENFNPDPDNLKDKIAEKLFRRAGKIRIIRVLGEFVRLAQEKLRIFQALTEEKKEQARACGMDKKKLDEKIKALKEFCKEIDDLDNNTRSDYETQIRMVTDKLKDSCYKINGKIMKRLQHQIDGMDRTADIKVRIPIFFMEQIRKEYQEMKMQIKKTKEDIYNYIDEKKEDILSIASKYGIFEDLASAKYIDQDFNIKIDELIKKVSSFSDDLDQQLPGAFLDIFTRMSTIQNDTIACANKALEAIGDDFSDICSELCDLAYEQMDQYRENVGEWANTRRTNLTAVQNESLSKDNLQKDYYAKAEILQKQSDELTKKINDLKSIEVEASSL